MAEAKLKGIGSFSWASAAQFQVYIATAAELKEIGSNSVYCFPLARVGITKLLSQKMKTLTAVKDNMQKLERFVGIYKEGIKPEAMVYIRSLYHQFKLYSEILERHVEVACMLQDRIVESAIKIEVVEGEEDEDELPF